MSLINEALKNIDLRSRETGKQYNYGLTSSSLVAYPNDIDSQNPESKFRIFTFPFLCLCLCLLFVVCSTCILAYTLTSFDFEEHDGLDFPLTMKNDIKINRQDHVKSVAPGFVMGTDMTFLPKLHDPQFLLLTQYSDALSIKKIDGVNGPYGFPGIKKLGLHETNSDELGQLVYKEQGMYGVLGGSDIMYGGFQALKKQFFLAVKNNRLMFPKHNSAWYFLKQIKRLNNNVFYEEGLSHIEDAYHRLIQKKINSGDANRAKKYLDRLMTINGCLLYTSPSPRDRQKSRMPSSA